ncbi:spore germination protein [Sporobacter termitidis DSM 10068]|uniref:Spore germination protein n=1 Tax=Sporobacter termitidis DSM 10068 TaxID=1123282 RepID=A0A1M5VLC8_9FIRM|nr:LysM peptidoglycan-binding domain-containing protein [Sporobacter termitidis]SHH76027.1 spore germination protein [Sporobacter termitidis DSM 10068]
MLIHIVKPGDTLRQLAGRYGVTMAAVAAVNSLPDLNRLAVGEALVIPTEDMNYTVKSGDSLWRIADTLGTTVQAIIRKNPDVDPNRLTPGQVLYIPAGRYTVRTGDTLYGIARRYGVPLERLLQANGISDPNLIYPGTVLVIPLKRQRPGIDVNGYIYVFGQEAVPIVTEAAGSLTYLTPFAYLIREDGSLQEVDDTPAIAAAYRGNVVPMMCLTNFTSTSLGDNLAHAVLSNPQVVERLLDNVIGAMQYKGYLALNIDFEAVLPADQELYNSFLQRAVDRLHPLGYQVSSALAPKYSAAQAGALYEAHDYAAHGRILDFVILMTYEWGARRGEPQAISPLNAIRRVLDYAVTVIPRDKIFFGFQIYARDWLLPHVAGQEAETFSCEEARLRAVRYGAEIQFDEASQSPYYRYTDERGRGHIVWFEDARSAQAKFDTVKAYGLRGISYWALGYPFPQNWALLNDNFTVRKLLGT